MLTQGEVVITFLGSLVQLCSGEGGDRGDLVEKQESPKGERTVKPLILLPSKNGYRRLGS